MYREFGGLYGVLHGDIWGKDTGMEEQMEQQAENGMDTAILSRAQGVGLSGSGLWGFNVFRIQGHAFLRIVLLGLQSLECL